MSDPLELELQVGVSFHVGAENETRSSVEEEPLLLTAKPSLCLLLLYFQLQ